MHTFEIQINGNVLEGSLTLSAAGDPIVSYDYPPQNMTLLEMERINLIFRAVEQLHKLGAHSVKRLEIAEVP